MTMLDMFTPDARHTIVRAGTLASQAGRGRLGDVFLLLALAEDRPLGVEADDIRAAAGARPGRDRELLATLGIDLDEVRRRVHETTAARPDDPALWSLRRAPLRPLRVTLSGPGTELVLDESGRKAVEVALWARRRAHRARAGRADLLWGLLADGSSEAVDVLRRLGADLRALWTELGRAA
ncbi:Clp protease N-terminal domain-containing protein [Actinomadura sp. 3N407]|uniref:Clp protease N-terminal domain-containing protein n=1 Tax=Actinomadura sp. 3N407 TaxID=3457423 RepID=UPI003FCC2898